MIDPITIGLLLFCAGAATATLLTTAMVVDYAREARKRHRDAIYSEIIKQGITADGCQEVQVIDIGRSGQVLNSKTFKASELDEGLKQKSRVTTVWH